MQLCKRCSLYLCECPYAYCECGNPIYKTLQVMCNGCIRYEHKQEQETYCQLSSYLILFHYFHDTMLQATLGLCYEDMERAMSTIPWETIGITMPSIGRVATESTLQAMRQQMEYHG